jgi:putative thioredoxin
MSASTSKWVVNVDEANFEREVVERSRERPVVVDFWAPWCRPCQMLGPLLEKLVEERGGEVILAKVNTDQAQRLAYEYRIEGIPAVKAFRDGRPVLEFVGLLPEAQLRAFLDRLSPTEADRLARRGDEMVAAKPAEAEALYRRVLDQDRDHEAAVLGLARLLIDRGQYDEAEGLLERIVPAGDRKAEAERLEATLFLRRLARSFGDEATLRRRLEAEPDNAEVRYQRGVVLAAAGKYPEALGMLLSAAERDRKLAAEKVREAMVKIFQVIGVRSPLADEYRDKLARLLY